MYTDTEIKVLNHEFREERAVVQTREVYLKRQGFNQPKNSNSCFLSRKINKLIHHRPFNI